MKNTICELEHTCSGGPPTPASAPSSRVRRRARSPPRRRRPEQPRKCDTPHVRAA
nr:MAG TPA: hypothetical protein [Caudoviricetes sp.]